MQVSFQDSWIINTIGLFCPFTEREWSRITSKRRAILARITSLNLFQISNASVGFWLKVRFIIIRYDCLISLGRGHGCTAAFSSLLLSKFLYHVETVLSSNIDFLSSLTDRVIYFIQEYLFTNLQGTKSYQYLFFRHRNWKKVGDTQPPCCSERNFILASEDRKVIEPTFDFHKESWNFYKRFILMGL